MLFCCVTVIVLYYILLKNVIHADILSKCPYELNLFDDGPVTLDVPVTVTAQLNCVPENTTFTYFFKDNTQRFVRVQGYDSAAASFIFTEKPGAYTIHVFVYPVHLKHWKVASGSISVKVYEFIPGTLNVSSTVEDKDGHQYVGTGYTTNITLDIHYPLHVLQDAEFSYSWSIGDDRFANDKPFIIYPFNQSGLKMIMAEVVGRIPAYDATNHIRYKWGYFNKEITVKDPFYNINISGNTYLEHGQLLTLDISCSGSGPVDYCWKMLPVSKNHTNFSCSDLVTSAECSIPILYYFRETGDFQLAIYISNLVTSLSRNIEVHIYDVSLRPQLSMVIIPVVCTVLVVIIIAFGLIYMHRKPAYNVETADFDFMRMEEPTAVAVETSWEHMWRSLVRLLQLRCFSHSLDIETISTAHYGTIIKGK